jgi:hypothetical protein
VLHDEFAWGDNPETGRRELAPAKRLGPRYVGALVVLLSIMLAAAYGFSLLPGVPGWLLPAFASFALLIVGGLAIMTAAFHRKELERGPLLAIDGDSLLFPRKGDSIPLSSLQGVRIVRGFLGWRGAKSGWTFHRQGCVVWVDEAGELRETVVYWGKGDTLVRRALKALAREQGLAVFEERVPRQLYESVVEPRNRW